MADRVCLGVVVGAHGIRGAVRIKAFTGDPAAVAAYGPVEDESGARRFRLKVLGVGKGGITAAVEGVADRDAAEGLKGVRLYVPRAALPGTAEDEFYHSDLVGLRVERRDGSVMGTVRAVYDFGAGDVIEVATAEGGVELFPFTRAVFPEVDVAGGRLVVEPPAVVEARPEAEGEREG